MLSNETHGKPILLLGTLIAVLLCWAGTGIAEETEGHSRLAPERILVIGDSHSMGHFGSTMHKQLRTAYPDAKVTLIAACGKGEAGILSGGYAHCGVLERTPKGGVKRPKGCKKNPCKPEDGPECNEQDCRPPKLKALLRKVKPDWVLLQLGSNSWFKGSLQNGWAAVEQRVTRIADLIGERGAKCLWITAPDSAKRPADSQDAFAAMYERVLDGKCTVFNSRPVFRPYMDFKAGIARAGKAAKRNDGTHYGTLGATGQAIEAQWVSDILATLEGEFSSPQAEPDGP